MDRDVSQEITLADRLGLPGATFYHVGLANIQGYDNIVFQKELFTLLEEHPETQTLIVDLEGVESISKQSLGILSQINLELGYVHGRVVLLDVPGNLKKRFDNMGYSQLFEQLDSNK